MMNRLLNPSAKIAKGITVRNYPGKWPRPKPGTSEKPPYYAPDPLVNNPKALSTPLEGGELTFIHRPPPTAPSPHSLTSNPVSPLLRAAPATEADEADLPPYLRPSANIFPEKRLSDSELIEMKRLRKENPKKYTQGKLAEMFGCTPRFVSLKAALPKPARKRALRARDADHQEVREGWSDHKTLVRDVRKKRMEFW